MSVQSDIEFLTIQAIEKYSQKNKTSFNETTALFQNHQVFEKIITQHEYLHQVDTEYLLEFVEKTISQKQDSLILFHGTVSDFDTINLEKAKNRRDFGKGFYTTLLSEQAQEWAHRMSLRENSVTYYVYQYSFMINDSLKIKRFNALDKEWLDFIKENRINGGIQHDYDVVIGPVADDNTLETVQLYLANALTTEEAINRLKYSKVNNQVSFHSKKALTFLTKNERFLYEL